MTPSVCISPESLQPRSIRPSTPWNRPAKKTERRDSAGGEENEIDELRDGESFDIEEFEHAPKLEAHRGSPKRLDLGLGLEIRVADIGREQGGGVSDKFTTTPRMRKSERWYEMFRMC